jgi:hypothetical protein
MREKGRDAQTKVEDEFDVPMEPEPTSEIPPEFASIANLGEGYVVPPVTRLDKYDIQREDPDSLVDLDPNNFRDHIELEVTVDE